MCGITSIGSLSRALLCVLVISVLSPAAAGIHKGSPASCGDHACDHGDGETASNRELVPIARLMYSAMPPGERAKLRAAGALGAPDDGALASGSRPERGDARRWLERRLDTLNDGSFTADQRDALRSIADAVDEGRGVPMMCFAPGTDPEYASMMNALLYAPNPIAFQQADRWGRTALSGPGLQQGDPTTITYSFVPDGTFVDASSFPDGNSLLFIWLNNIYGSPGAWQDLFHQVFDRWEELVGVNYVHEPNDDGVPVNSSNDGVAGTRGDVRISAITLDGNSGVLAFNFFPNSGGDMVFDAFDSFYQNLSVNSLRMRNVIAHEHGHGLGMFHVCPVTQSKLMEPFISTAFDGPQIDDILNGHRHYGDPMEPSDVPTDATELGTLSQGGSSSMDRLSIDDGADTDWFVFTLTEESSIVFEVVPDAGSYDQGPQTQDCESGSFTNYNRVMDFRVSIYDSDNPDQPIKVVDTNSPTPSSDFTPAETLELGSAMPGTYLIEIESVGSKPTFESSNTDVQKYKVDLSIGGAQFQGPVLAVDDPGTLPPFTPGQITLSVDPRQDTLAGAPVLFSRTQPSGPFAAEPMTQSMPMTFTGELPPASCDEVLQYYIAVEGEVVGEVTFPPEGPSSPISVDLGEPVLVLEDDFETQIGWTVEGTITSTLNGRWERGVPQGDGSRGDPPQDADGSGQCYITGNTGSGVNSDVDGGESILVSPAFDLSGTTDPILSYARWYDNTGSGFGSGPGEDTLKIDVTDGVTTIEGDTVWYPLEIVGPDSPESTGGWFDVEFRLSEALADLVDSGEFDLSTTQFQGPVHRRRSDQLLGRRGGRGRGRDRRFRVRGPRVLHGRSERRRADRLLRCESLHERLPERRPRGRPVGRRLGRVRGSEPVHTRVHRGV